MNAVIHALAGVAVAHTSFRLSARPRLAPEASPGALTLAGAALAGVASHGLLDWLRHGYPIPSFLDVTLALALSAIWLALVRARLRPLFAIALMASFMPDVVDHLPRMLHVSSPLPHPLFPWHAARWSGSLYPAAHIRPNTHLVALETGNNALASAFNHALVIAAAIACIFIGREAIGRRSAAPN